MAVAMKKPWSVRLSTKYAFLTVPYDATWLAEFKEHIPARRRWWYPDSKEWRIERDWWEDTLDILEDHFGFVDPVRAAEWKVV